ncbi:MULTISPECIES: formylglycine-generating enzyme family protein [unclassified Microcoleus]|uniref:formylglycine-generating enzyme family protein n=1 Tax=unclassified Microcoleus TaxID=2642155 RepID=UPI0025EB4E19|nr:MULTISPECIES: formylglycine-generating enzyme family protein [unclassified Microcoleus]
MPSEQNRPKEYDAVLGGQNLIPSDAAVLGGVAGVKSRLGVPSAEVRIAALSDALKYGDAGLDLIIGAVRDKSIQVQLAACSLLKDINEDKIKQHLPNDSIFEFDVITVDSDGQQISCRKSFAFYFPEDIGNEIVEMVYIPGGTFMMGSPLTELGRMDHESPQHEVTVPAFFAGKYPITQAQWQAVMGNNPSSYYSKKHTVDKIPWDDAVLFCDRLSQHTGKKYRLLSEAEWEYACRAGTTTPFHFGDTITPELANYYMGGPFFRAREADRFPPNAFGLYGMHGNVQEWCNDDYSQNYFKTPTDGSSWEPRAIINRVMRGGSAKDGKAFCRSAARQTACAWPSDIGKPILPNDYIGFRIAVRSIFVEPCLLSQLESLRSPIRPNMEEMQD